MSKIVNSGVGGWRRSKSKSFSGKVGHDWCESFSFPSAACNILELKRLQSCPELQNGEVVLGRTLQILYTVMAKSLA